MAPDLSYTMANGGDIVVHTENLTKRYGERVAVDSISFDIRRGEVFGFLGPNGAGKTTTIRLLCGILQPTSGSGHTLGFDIFTESEKIKSKIGYMSQKFSLYDDLSVIENLRFYAGVQNIPQPRRNQRIEEMLKLANLSDRRTQLTGELSGGWKQRLALTCALVHEPELIFLDEPTSGVDPVSRRRFWDMIYKISETGATFLVTTHYMDEAEQFDRLLFIDRGKIIANGSPEELKSGSFRYKIWDVICDPLASAAGIVAQLDYVHDVSLSGNKLHVLTDKSIDDPQKLRQALESSDVSVEKITSGAPTLEDVFVNLADRDSDEFVTEKDS